jgi:RHS repeat-associated protein
MQMPGRSFTSGDGYRYGFNGMERDDEIKGNGNSYDFGARIYDSRIGRWLALDPLMKDFPSHTPYMAFGNNPIIYIDPDGKRLVLKGKRRKAFRELKKMTSDKIKLKMNGEVVIISRAPNPDKEKGTNLLSKVIGAEQTASLTIHGKDPKLSEKTNTTRPPSGIAGEFMLDGMKLDAYIDVSTFPEIIPLRGGGSGESILIATLANELSHASRILEGEVEAAYVQLGEETLLDFSFEEILSTIDENIIREEQGISERHAVGGYGTALPAHHDTMEQIPNPDSEMVPYNGE